MATAVELRDISQKTRDKAKDSDFAGRNRSFPILKPEDVDAALKSIGRAGSDNYSADELKRRILRIAKRKGFPIPKSDEKQSTSVHLPPTAISLADDAADGPARTWIQVLRVGKFWSPRYKDFSVTKSTLSKMVENFLTVTPKAPTELPLDYNHGTNRPETVEQGKAAGWIKSLELRADGTELWADVALTAEAAELVRNEEYRFVSATFEFDHTHTDGEDRQKKIGPTLMAAALTNTPFVEGMAPVSLSDAIALADDEGAEGEFSYDEQRRRVQGALSDIFGVGDYGCCGVYLEALFDGYAIYCESDGCKYRVEYTLGADGVVTFMSDPVEVRVAYEPLPSGATEMAKTIKVKDAKGNEIELTEEVALALAKEHAPKPAAGGSDVTALSNRLDEMEVSLTKQQTEITELTAKNKALEDEKKQMHASQKVDALIRAGKIEPKAKEEWTKLALADRETFKKLTDVLPVIRTYGAGDGTSDDVEKMSAAEEVTALARQEQEKDAKLSLADATSRVFNKNPALYERYKKEAAIRV